MTTSVEPAPVPGRRAAVVYNPIKVDERAFRALVNAKAWEHGWPEPVFYATTLADAGQGATRRAVAEGAELVLAAGGDGTVRVVTTALRNTGVASAIVPVGTANLLARNLGISLDIPRALDIAFTGEPREIDLAQLVVDGDEANPVFFTGMAGVGFDAALMRDTDARLKKVVGSAAYLVAFAQQLGYRPRQVNYRVDDGPKAGRKAVLVLVGNTRSLQGGIELFPDAVVDDGKIDLLLASPRTLAGWARVLATVLHKLRRSKAVEYHGGLRFVIDLESEAPWEVDGDTEGVGRHFEFSVLPGALQIVTGR
ncbi:diacylglycerol kinase family protein [Propionimicrobium sp. PCR01-08-3]|uniref:diacylglycerol/lipid kinase family protein n=1 Tax=Propionimicrobium sp. PCR01-08-3 TaxID=3052086 RepID=UPI00255C2BC9|nr:diacylglycerol kinase family protein [Propionimicrobium sp. PCR01-08-3]WIY82714.1 diacylglycerol kinase family protein [Propionimicrobium sp. PCR01-08-3]